MSKQQIRVKCQSSRERCQRKFRQGLWKHLHSSSVGWKLRYRPLYGVNEGKGQEGSNQYIQHKKHEYRETKIVLFHVT